MTGYSVDECRIREWSSEDIKRVGYRVVDLIADHITSLPARSVFQTYPEELVAEYLQAPLPITGEAPENVLDQFSKAIEPFPFGNGHPLFFGWVNSPPAVMAVFGEALAAAMNPSCAGGNHAAVYVEHQVLNWFKEILGFPAESMGVLVSGGSMASLTALAVARHVKAGFDVRLHGLQGATGKLVVYKGAEGHSCVQKAVELLGIGTENLRIIESDGALRLSIPALLKAIHNDFNAGNIPIAVIASAGTVNSGAIDPLEDIADVCQEHGIWLHIDGAYGAPAILTDEYHGLLAAVARADSVALDPHKWLFVPVEAGLVLVKDAEAMRSAFSLVPAYLRTDGNARGINGPPWFSEYGFQQTRGFRALKIWMALKACGMNAFRGTITHNIELARLLADMLRLKKEFEVLEPQSLSIVCFRYRPAALRDKEDALGAFNSKLVERVQLSGRAFLSSTSVDGRFWMRACVVNSRTREEDIATLVNLITAHATELLENREAEPGVNGG